MNRTLTREQIEEVLEKCYFTCRQHISTNTVGEFVIPVDFMETALRQLLNSIPKAFDPEDETTWPPMETDEESKWVLVLPAGHVDAWIKYKGKWSWCERQDLAQKGRVTHYMPIPEVGEE